MRSRPFKKEGRGWSWQMDWMGAANLDFQHRTATRLMAAVGNKKLDASVQYDETTATKISREIWGNVAHVSNNSGEHHSHAQSLRSTFAI
jgi:hypothetical protein